MVKIGLKPQVPPEHLPDVNFSQPAPVQNTWYTVLDTTPNYRLYFLSIQVTDTDETLEVRATIDGNVLQKAKAATIATIYYVRIHGASPDDLLIDAVENLFAKSAPLDVRSVKIEIRKTTAAGAGTISAVLKRARWP